MASADEARQHLRFAFIACCPTHPSFNHRRSSYSGRGFPTVEHSSTERRVGIVSVCFQEMFEDPSLQSFFPRISCSACTVTHFGHYNQSVLLTYLHLLKRVANTESINKIYTSTVFVHVYLWNNETYTAQIKKEIKVWMSEVICSWWRFSAEFLKERCRFSIVLA